jgi:hypothetical protein
MEEGSGVSVAAVDLVPQRTPPARFQEARYKGGLAGPRGGRYPNGRMREAFFEHAEKALSRDGRIASRQLGERYGLDWRCPPRDGQWSAYCGLMPQRISV